MKPPIGSSSALFLPSLLRPLLPPSTPFTLPLLNPPSPPPLASLSLLLVAFSPTNSLRSRLATTVPPYHTTVLTSPRLTATVQHSRHHRPFSLLPLPRIAQQPPPFKSRLSRHRSPLPPPPLFPLPSQLKNRRPCRALLSAATTTTKLAISASSLRW
ncbi:hypothetical protein RIF29_25790 [Crotalaria pallida]|uniref:Uncharacterized protein n=1 Tax=Crotalaria pallida TaxID=3830 RepID=A0AAN9EM07_CROPI